MKIKKFMISVATLVVLSLPSAAFADLDPNDPNYSVCLRIVKNCSAVGFGGYGSYQECWMDQGDPWCPEAKPDPWGPHSYGNPWFDETFWVW